MTRLEYDYAHCVACDRLINLDIDLWYSDGNDTFCTDCTVLNRRQELEREALQTICACWYYDFADSIDAMTDDELIEVIANNGVECVNCG